MKGSLIIISFFIIGTLCGVYHLIPYDFTQSNLSYYALCALMFSVGISVGIDPQTVRNFDHSRHIGRMRNNQFIPLPPFFIGLSGCRLRIRLLFIVKHLHNRI